METFSNLSPKQPHSSSDCIHLGRSSSPSLPYFTDCKFGFEANLKPKICITTSTSAGLEQILPWMFYHKVLGVSTFFLFVEGHAASPNISKVLESIPGVTVIYRTKELEDQQAKSEIKLEEAAVLHYTYAKFSDLTSRRDRCGCKPTKEDVKRCFMLEFDRAAFIIASTATEEEMLNWYREHVVWGDKDLRLKLLRKGILTRIYAPMAIVQGLRESGVFSSVIANAPTTISKDKFLASIDSSNSSRHNSPPSLTTRKVGRSRQHQPAVRKVLETEASAAHEVAAVPPLSPPACIMAIYEQ